jgi:hypothetical protein
MRRSSTWCYITVLIAISLMVGCSDSKPHVLRSAEVKDEQPLGPPLTPPSEILVGRFELGSTKLKTDPGLAAQIARERPKVLFHNDEPSDPVKRLEYLDNLLAEDVTRKLKSKGLPARRRDMNVPLPKSGWLVGGALLSVDEGNRRRRAVLGFGLGASDAKLHVAVADLSQGGIPSAEDMLVDAQSGRMPGGVVTLNPIHAAALFALNGESSERDMEKAAEAIASEVDSLVKTSRAQK